MSIFGTLARSDEEDFGRVGRGGGGGGRGHGFARHHPRAQSSSSSISSSGGYPYATYSDGGGSGGGGLDLDAIADQVVADIAQNPQFGGEEAGGSFLVPSRAITRDVRNRTAEAQRVEAKRKDLVDHSYLLQGLENPDLADTLFPEGDRIDRRSMVMAGPSYGRTPDVQMDRIVSLAPQERGAYPRVSRADLFGSDGGEPEVDAYGFACPVPARTRDRMGALDVVAGVTEPSSIPAEFFGATERRAYRDARGLGYGTMGLPSTAPRPENLRYGTAGLPSTAPRPENVTRYGDDSQKPGTFSESLLTGLGIGLGVATAFVGVSVLARALR